MKKIYMILAVIALLTLSLDAQLKATKSGKAVSPKSFTEKEADMSQPGIIIANNNAGQQAPARAPKRADRATQTWSWVGDEDGTSLPTGWSLSVSNTALNDNGDGTWFIGGQVANRGITIDASVFTGYTNITVVVRGKIDTGYSGKSVTVNGNSQTLTNTIANYTWTNVDATSGIVIGVTDGYVGLESITITGESSSSGGTVEETICDGTNTNGNLPIYGLYVDNKQINQMIYPSSLLTNLVGKTLTSMTFYANAALDSKLASGTWTIKLGTTTQTTFGTTLNNTTRLVPTDVTAVVSGYHFTTGSNKLTIVFDTPFTYNGDNLLIDFEETAYTSDYNTTTFYGVTQSSGVYTGFNSYGTGNIGSNGHYTGGGVRNFLPKVTFTYEEDAEPEHDLAIALSAPATAGAGGTVTLTATVTNNGDLAENGYTVTFTANGTTINTQTAATELAAGASTTFYYTYTTTDTQAGTSVNFGASVACADDIDTSNNEATASTSVLTCPPPENVQATVNGQNATMTWEAPIIPMLPTVVTENFDDTSVFPSFSVGGITATVHTGSFGDWTVYEPSGHYVWGLDGSTYDHQNEPVAWQVFNPSSISWTNALAHSGSQYMLSFCDAGEDDQSTNMQATNHWLISPELSGNEQTITFWERIITTQYGSETYEVLASSTDNDPSSFSLVQSITSGETTWTQRTVTLPAGTKYFAIRHTSYDVFGIMVDDVTYQIMVPGEQPTSYKIYLDGQYVTTVPSTTFSYDFTNVPGEHTCAVSAVYTYGESVAVPVTFITTPKTDAPDISYVTTESSVIITATADDPTAAVSMTVNGETVTGTGSVSYTITRGNADQTANVSATAQESGKLVSDPATDQITVPALPVTAEPVITWERVGDNVVITATGDGTVTLNAGGQTATGNGTASITIPCGADTQSIVATATAQDVNHQVSPTATATVTVPYLETAAPVISYTDGDDAVTVTATGDGTVIMYVDGVAVTQPYVAQRHMQDYTITVTATAQESGHHISETTTSVITVTGLITTGGWQLMTGTYSGHQSLSFVDSLTNKAIMFADSISAMTFDNHHPDHYDYWLEEAGHSKTSNLVTIPVFKTYSTMFGLYTQTQVDEDTLRTLTANSPNVTLTYDINTHKDMYNYSLYRSAINSDVDSIKADTQPVSKLTYEYMSQLFGESQNLDPYNVQPNYQSVGSSVVKRVDYYFNNAVGQPKDYENYVPVIWTMGSHTGRTDGKNNSYGSDIKRNTLGDVVATIEVESSDYKVKDQEGNWVYGNGVWSYNNQLYTVYTPIIYITGTPPALYEANDGDTVTYEPYMFRAWCLNENVRDFVRDPVTQLLTDNGELTAPILLDTHVKTIDLDTIGGTWEYGMDRLQWSFAAPVGLTKDDLTFAVRFYYRAVLKSDSGMPLLRRANRDGLVPDEQYLIVETTGNPDDIWTGIDDMFYDAGRVPVSTTYVNSLGQTSNRPFEGLNIIVTRYSDGTSSTVKVMR